METHDVILSFQHKGLEVFFRTGSKKGVQAVHANRIARILFALHHAEDPSDLKDLNRLHFLHCSYEGFFAVNVSANWRIIGRFVGKDVELVDYSTTTKEGETSHGDVQPATPGGDPSF